MLLIGPRLLRWSVRSRFAGVWKSNPVAYQLLFLLLATLACIALGVTAMFGAFLAGIVTSSVDDTTAAAARGAIKDFSFAFFIPVYFAVVGLQLDLVHHFDPLFFLWFTAFACVAKSLSVYIGSRLAGETHASSTNFAVAMNARGGPGIVLASVALGAGIINAQFYASLILLVIVSSQAAGAWLDRQIRTGRPLRDETPEVVVVPDQTPAVVAGS
jgi:Kef-type K+ transport system membrane component KefB